MAHVQYSSFPLYDNCHKYIVEITYMKFSKFYTLKKEIAVSNFTKTTAFTYHEQQTPSILVDPVWM